MADESQGAGSLKGVPAAEILAKIEKGEPVKYEHVIISGNINISKLNLPKDGDKFLVKSSIEISDSEIFGSVDFGNTIQLSMIVFQKTKFIMNASFCGTQFNEASYFAESVFDLGASFDGSRFKENASFTRAKFNLGARFVGALFEANAFFMAVDFGCNSDFRDANFNGEANFMNAQFTMKTDFTGTKFIEIASFGNAKFGSHTSFEMAQFCKKIYFNRANSYGSLDFSKTRFCEDAHFEGTQIESDMIFNEAKLGGRTAFDKARINGDASFREASFLADALFVRTVFGGNILTFRDAEFKIPKIQEEACRKAKILLEKNGNREEAGYHFYREMDAKRKQKPWYIRYPEFVFIQLIFGYGIHPFRLWACWFTFVGIFAAIYWFGQGIDPIASQQKGNATFVDYIWFSIATAVTPGYAGYQPTMDFKLVAGLEAIFGTFMWAAFIATFARKYMR